MVVGFVVMVVTGAVVTDMVLVVNGSASVLSRVDVRQGYVSSITNVTLGDGGIPLYPQLLAVQPGSRVVYVTATETGEEESAQLLGTLDVESGVVSVIASNITRLQCTWRE